MNSLNRGYHYLLLGALTTIWCAGLTGLSVRNSPVLFLFLHFICGASVIALTVVFVRRHWLPRRDKIVHHPNTRLGYTTLACIFFLVTSGLSLIKWTNVQTLRWLHAGVTALEKLNVCECRELADSCGDGYAPAFPQGCQ